MTITAKATISTWGKYNAGSLKGLEVDLTDYTDLDEVWEAARKFHSDEHDPEFMISDYRCDIEGAIDENGIAEEIFEILDMDEWEQEICAAFSQLCSYDMETIVNDARDRHAGTADTCADFAEDFYEQTSGVKFSELFRQGLVIDWQATWDRNLRHDFDEVRHNGDLHFFRVA